MPETAWWKKEAIYQIYTRSFNDTNGDGIGDIPGIIEKLDYLKGLGVGIIWLSPVYASPDRDNGYDISDYRAIHPGYGTMEDMDRLIDQAGQRGIRIIMDLVINHTSDRHEWFQKSRKGIEPYRDYYIWRDGKKGKLPNNWTSFFAEDCWVFDEERQQYYLHLFAKEQPDLNYRNPGVLEEVKAVLEFWLDKGVAGFRCDVINVIFKNSLDNGRRKLVLTGSEHYLSTPGNHEILKELRRDVLDRYDCFTVGETVFVTPEEGRMLSHPDRKELDMIFSFEHMEADQYFVKWFKRKFSPRRFGRALDRWQREIPWNANYFENHDQLRSVSRFGDDRQYHRESATMLATLLLSLRGSPFIFQGQEIGMTNFDYKSMDEVEDVESHNVYAFLKGLHLSEKRCWNMIRASSRDNGRTPVQWSAGRQSGFTTGTPWLGINGNYVQINVESQMEDPDSIWNYYRRMLALRRNSPVLIDGDYEPLKISKRLFAFRRILKNKRWAVLLNFSSKTVPAECQGRIIMGNYKRDSFDGKLNPYEGIILEETETSISLKPVRLFSKQTAVN